MPPRARPACATAPRGRIASPARLAAGVVAAIEPLRRQRLTGPAIARKLGVPVSTVGAVLRRRGLGRLAALEPKPPVIRYEREHPGELIHLDIKKLGRIQGIGHRITGDRKGQSATRGAGWEDLHVAIDDASRLAYTELLPNERKESATAFLIRALGWFERHGVTVARVMTDNGSCDRSKLFRETCAAAEARHLRTKPYTPRTNGKAERASEHPSGYVIEEKRFCWSGCDPAGYLGFWRARSAIDWAAGGESGASEDPGAVGQGMDGLDLAGLCRQPQRLGRDLQELRRVARG